MKANIYFTADWHFNHDNILQYCNRPYKDVNEMNEDIIKKYNFYIRGNDVCYILGDVGFGDYDNFKEVFSKLNGKKILVLGNHDKWSMQTYYNVGFDAVVYNAHIKLGKHIIYLNHIPTRTFKEFIRLMWVYFIDNKRKNWNIRNKINRLKKEWGKYRKATKEWTLCGHVHQAWKIRNKNINCGIDVWDFKPVSSDKILDIINKGGVL